MKERPILFSAPMVRALLDGSKSQTRRIVKREPLDWLDVHNFAPEYVASHENGLSPYGYSGDLLWVREAWRIGAWCEDDGALAIDYLASEPAKTPWIVVPEDAENYHGGSVFEKYWIQSTDDCIESKLSTDDSGTYHWAPGQSPCRKRPSIHMPRWASRITLEVTGVRVERLHAISEADAIAEGIRRGRDGMWNGAPHAVKGTPRAFHTAVGAYDDLWTQINGPGSWTTNPWVWVVEFRRIES